MATCPLCGKPAGLFRSVHEECQRKKQEAERKKHDGTAALLSLITRAPFSSDVDLLPERIRQISSESLLGPEEVKAIKLEGWSAAVKTMIEDHIIQPEQESALSKLATGSLELTQEDVNGLPAFNDLVKSVVLRELLQRSIPAHYDGTGIPINLQKGERIIWGFPNCVYLKDKTKTIHVGTSAGISVKVAKGLYFRTGNFQGQSIETSQRNYVDTGWLALTDKNLYFTGPAAALRLPYAKIVSFQRFPDGIGIVRDASSAKPEVFVTSDGWYTYNLITNLAEMAAGR
jgi:hypothetical protein